MKINIMLHQGLVKSIAYQSRNRCTTTVDLDDLIQAGNIGLMRAAKDYDETKGAFSTYATLWIREAMDTELNNNARTVRIPRAEMRKAIKEQRAYCKEGSELTEEYAHTPDLDNELDIATLYATARKHVLVSLSPLQQEIIMLTVTKDMTPKEIGDKLGYTYEWIRQLKIKALAILRTKMDEDNARFEMNDEG